MCFFSNRIFYYWQDKSDAVIQTAISGVLTRLFLTVSTVKAKYMTVMLQ